MQTNKRLRGEVRELRAYIEGMNVGANPFHPLHWEIAPYEQDTIEYYGYLSGYIYGWLNFQDIEIRLEHCFRENIATDRYAKELNEA